MLAPEYKVPRQKEGQDEPEEVSGEGRRLVRKEWKASLCTEAGAAPRMLFISVWDMDQAPESIQGSAESWGIWAGKPPAASTVSLSENNERNGLSYC